MSKQNTELNEKIIELVIEYEHPKGTKSELLTISELLFVKRNEDVVTAVFKDNDAIVSGKNQERSENNGVAIYNFEYNEYVELDEALDLTNVTYLNKEDCKALSAIFGNI